MDIVAGNNGGSEPPAKKPRRDSATPPPATPHDDFDDGSLYGTPAHRVPDTPAHFQSAPLVPELPEITGNSKQSPLSTQQAPVIPGLGLMLTGPQRSVQ